MFLNVIAKIIMDYYGFGLVANARKKEFSFSSVLRRRQICDKFPQVKAPALLIHVIRARLRTLIETDISQESERTYSRYLCLSEVKYSTNSRIVMKGLILAFCIIRFASRTFENENCCVKIVTEGISILLAVLFYNIWKHIHV